MKIIFTVSALVAVVATFVSSAPTTARDTHPSVPNPPDYPLPYLEPPKKTPPFIIIDRSNRTRAANGTNGLAKAATPCRSITFTWWSLRYDGDPEEKQYHSGMLEVSGSKVPFERELTNQHLGNPSTHYYLRQWGIRNTYFFDHCNLGPDQPKEIMFVTGGKGYTYPSPNERFERSVYSEYFQKYGTSTNSLYYDCISWPS